MTNERFDEQEIDLLQRRRQAVLEIGRLELEDVPDPETLCRQLEATYDPGGID